LPRAHRVGSKPARVLITMVRDFAPKYFRASPQLQSALQLPGGGGTHGEALRALRAHALAHSAPDPADPSLRRADAELQALLGSGEVGLDDLHRHLDAHLSPLDPVSLDYTIQLDGPSPSALVCHDVEVAWPLKPSMLRLPPFLERLDVKEELDAHDAKITGAHSLLSDTAVQRRCPKKLCSVQRLLSLWTAAVTVCVLCGS
jgi:hypothetical protein